MYAGIVAERFTAGYSNVPLFVNTAVCVKEGDSCDCELHWVDPSTTMQSRLVDFWTGEYSTSEIFGASATIVGSIAVLGLSVPV